MDNINHPNHYENSCSIECIEAMEMIYGKKALYNFCKLNAFKYIWRYKNKNGKEDLEKANWYCNKSIALLNEMYEEIITSEQITDDDCFKEEEQINRMKKFINKKLKKEVLKEI